MSNTKSLKKVTNALKKCNISSERTADIVFTDSYDINLISKWPKLKTNVPAIFLHQPINFTKYVRKLLNIGIQFYMPSSNRYRTKITCCSFNDQKSLMQYFDLKQLPYHTFGHPSKSKLKVVIRGLPDDMEIDKLKSELKLGGVPIIRLHKMHRRPGIKDNKALILAVVPYNEEGKKILLLKQIFSYDVILEPPKITAKQCHRCQQWGHIQRYCHGRIKCVKCAGDHWSKKCDNELAQKNPKCANCEGNHTASFRECSCCPDSITHQIYLLKKLHHASINFRPSQLVTFENYTNVYHYSLGK